MFVDGLLSAERIDFTGRCGLSEVSVSAREVDAAVARLLELEETSYSVAAAATLLSVSREQLYDLVAAGVLKEVTRNGRARRARHGNRGGALPGGGRRIDKEGVDKLREADADRIMRRSTWLTVGEAALFLRLSRDEVRRLADIGELAALRDERSHKRERLIDPESAKRYWSLHGLLSLGDAAEELGRPVVEVWALMKVGVLEPGTRAHTVMAASLERYRNLRGGGLLAG